MLPFKSDKRKKMQTIDINNRRISVKLTGKCGVASVPKTGTKFVVTRKGSGETVTITADPMQIDGAIGATLTMSQFNSLPKGRYSVTLQNAGDCNVCFDVQIKTKCSIGSVDILPTNNCDSDIQQQVEQNHALSQTSMTGIPLKLVKKK